MTTRVIDNLLVRVGYEVDEASRRRAANSLQNMQRTLKSFSVGMAAAGTAVTDVTTKAVTTFASQQATFAKIEGLVGVARSEIEKMIPAVDKLAVATGVGPQKLADALFYVTSAGYRGAEALDILAASARAEVAGLGQAAQVADLATSAINAYGSENLSAAEAMDQLAMAVRLGKLETESIAPVIGRVVPLASRLQIPLQDVLGILAAMSRTGTDAAEGATQLNAVMSQLIKPSQAGEDLIYEKLGMSMQDVRDAIADKGLLPVLGMLEESVDKNVASMGVMFNNIRSLKGVFDLLGENAEATTEIMQGMAEAEGTLNEAFEINVRTLKGQYGRVMAASAVLWKNLGEAMAPVVEDKLVLAIEYLSELTDWFKEQPEWFKQSVGWLALLGPALLGAGLGASVLSMALGGLKLILAPVLGLFAGLSLPVWAFIAALVALWFGIVWIWGPQIEAAWDKLKEALIDPLIAEIKTWWDEKMWPAIQKAWEEQDFEPIFAAIETLWDEILWPAIQKAWALLKLHLVDPILAKIETWWNEQEWTDIEWWWNHLRNILNPILALIGIEIPDWDEIVAAWNRFKAAFIDPVIAQILTWWDETMWPAIQKAWEEQDFEPIFAAIETLWDEILWPLIQKAWEKLEEVFIDPILAKIETWWNEQEWTDIEWWWNHLRNILNPILALIGIEIPDWDEIVAAWNRFKAAFIDPVIAQILTWWDETMWPAIQKAWEEQDFEPIFAAIETLWDEILWPLIQKAWEKLEEVFIDPILAKIETWWNEQEWTSVEWWWNHLRDNLNPILTHLGIEIPTLDEMKQKITTLWNQIKTWWTGVDAEGNVVGDGAKQKLELGLNLVPPVFSDIWQSIEDWWTTGDGASTGKEGTEHKLPLKLDPKLPTWQEIKDKASGILSGENGEGLSLVIGSITAVAGAIGVARLLSILKATNPVGLALTIASLVAGGTLPIWMKDWLDGVTDTPVVKTSLEFISSNWNAFLQNLGIGGTDDSGTENAGISVSVTPAWIIDPIGHLQTTLTDKFSAEGVGFEITEGNLTVTLGEGAMSFEVPGWEALKKSFMEGFLETADQDKLDDFIPKLRELADELAFFGGAAALAALGAASFADELGKLLTKLTGSLVNDAYDMLAKITSTLQLFRVAIQGISAYIAAGDDEEKKEEAKEKVKEEVDEIVVQPLAERHEKRQEYLDETLPDQDYGRGIYGRYGMYSGWSRHQDEGSSMIKEVGKFLGGIGSWAYEQLGGTTESHTDPDIVNDFANQDSGGISVSRTLRWLSYNNRPEAIIPLHRFDEVMRPFMNQMMPAMAGGSGTVQIDQRVGDIHVNVSGSGGDANAIAREVGAEVRKQFRDLADEMDSAIRR